jgi:tRNA(Arg) A34 adenosine deaminase TadA
MHKKTPHTFPKFELSLPCWISGHIPDPEHVYETIEERMELVIKLAEMNIKHGGGPFGAGVFDMKAGTLLAPGINLVLSSRCSLAHAETVAIALAQQVSQTHDLGEHGTRLTQLVTSAEPCAMCFGAISWSGIASLVYGAESRDVCKLGFDEGPKPENWIAELEARNIQVTGRIRQKKAIDILHQYALEGGQIYNGQPG